MFRTKQKKLKDKGRKDGSPRYEEGQFTTYDQQYQKLKNASDFIVAKTPQKLDTRQNCKSALRRMKGDKYGKYKKGNKWYRASLPAAKQTLRTVYKDYHRWQADQVTKGKALETPDEWPQNHLEERLKAEADIDVCRLEISTIKERIEQIKAKDKAQHKREILPNGPLFEGGVPRKGRYKTVDGQTVSYDNNLPYIDEPDSPYNLMPIFYYKKMAYQWRQDIGVDETPLDLRGLRDIRDERYLDARQRAAERGEVKPTKKEPVTPSTLDRWLDRLRITRNDWPEWPSDAKAINELESEEQVS